VIVLTTGGFALLTPFPGAFVSPASLASSSGPPTAAGVSGTPINAPFFIMGSGGLSSVQPGNITGVPSLGLAGLTRAAAGPTSTINLGSGANDASALNIPSVTRNTIANDVLNPPPIIGGQPSGSNSPVLPPGQSYRGTTPTAAPRAATGGQAGASAPPSGVVSTPPTPYPPSVVPLVFPFKPPAGSMIPGVGSPPGSVPGGVTPMPVNPSQDSRQAGPSQSGRE